MTGASGLIGRAIAEGLEAEGAVVWRWDRRGTTAGRDVAADVTDSSAVERGVAKIIEADGRLDVLVHAAALTGRMGLVARPVVEMDLEQWQRVVDVNLTGAFLAARAVARAMVDRRGGVILLVGSVQGTMPTDGRSDYGCAKAGLHMLGRVMAGELAAFGIRVNVIVPGPVSELGASEAASTLRGTMGSPADVAHVACFLASDDAGFLTGALFPVDGGVTTAFRSEPPRADSSAIKDRLRTMERLGDRAKHVSDQTPPGRWAPGGPI